MATIDAHITGTVWTVEVAVGDRVEPDQAVVVLESMKMEMPVESQLSGIVVEILCESGQAVEEGAPLIRLEEV